MTIYTTEKRTENNTTVFAQVIYSSTKKRFWVLVCKRDWKHAWNRWANEVFCSADKAIRYAEVTVANYNL